MLWIFAEDVGSDMNAQLVVLKVVFYLRGIYGRHMRLMPKAGTQLKSTVGGLID